MQLLFVASKAVLRTSFFGGGDGVADFIKGFGIVLRGGLTAVVDYGHGLVFEIGGDVLCSFNKADVLLDAVFAARAVHLWVGSNYQGVYGVGLGGLGGLFGFDGYRIGGVVYGVGCGGSEGYQ